VTRKIIVLDPTMLKPGTINPQGKVIKTARLIEDKGDDVLVADIEYTDGTFGAFIWPLGGRWQLA
jgi:hypothetical protein